MMQYAGTQDDNIALSHVVCIASDEPIRRTGGYDCQLRDRIYEALVTIVRFSEEVLLISEQLFSFRGKNKSGCKKSAFCVFCRGYHVFT